VLAHPFACTYRLYRHRCRCLCSERAANRAELEGMRANLELALKRIEQLRREAARSTVCAHVPACARVRRHCSCARSECVHFTPMWHCSCAFHCDLAWAAFRVASLQVEKRRANMCLTATVSSLGSAQVIVRACMTCGD
jgi:hypothetical protein